MINKYEPGLIYHHYGHTSYKTLLNILYINNVQAYQNRSKTEVLLRYWLDQSQATIHYMNKIDKTKRQSKGNP